MRVVFGNGEKRLAITGPGGSVMDGVATFYPAMQLGPNEGLAEGPTDLVVAPRDDGFHLRSLIDPEPRRFDTEADLLSALEFGVTHFLLLGRLADTHLHASGVVVPGRAPRSAVLALGPSGSGKSSVALFWSRAGLPLLGDDIIILSGNGELSAFPRLLKVREERLEDAGVRTPRRLLFDAETREARFDPTHGAGWAEGTARPGVVARVRHEDGAGLRIRPLPTADALRLLLDSVLDTGLGPHESFPRFTQLLEEARFVDVVFEHAEEAARGLLELEP